MKFARSYQEQDILGRVVACAVTETKCPLLTALFYNNHLEKVILSENPCSSLVLNEDEKILKTTIYNYL